MVPEQLELTAGLLRALLSGLTAEAIQWKPAPERFSIAEVLAHLAHAEHHTYGVKYAQFAQEGVPVLESYDTDALVAGGAFSGKDAIESLADFERQRAANLILLRSLPSEFGARTGHHRLLGPIALFELVNECAFHDLGHIRQIAELIRAWKYYPHMGPYARVNKVNP